MPTFQYKAKTQRGELIAGSVSAGDRRLALAELGRLGYFPLSVAVSEPTVSLKQKLGGLGGHISSRDVLMFTQQLSTLLRSGMSLSQALGVLERRTQKKAFAAVMTNLRND